MAKKQPDNVTKLNHGHDELVRSVDIKTKTGTTNRPITKLYPLQVSLDVDTDSSTFHNPVPGYCGTNGVKSTASNRRT